MCVCVCVFAILRHTSNHGRAQARRNSVAPPHLVYFYTVPAFPLSLFLSRRCDVPTTLSLFLSLFLYLSTSVSPSFSLIRAQSFSLSLSRSFRSLLHAGAPLPLPPPCVYQVIGCEMKSNENPFRRVHSRSAVGRVAQPHPPLAPSSPLPLSDTAHLRFSYRSPSATSGDRRPVCITIAAR